MTAHQYRKRQKSSPEKAARRRRIIEVIAMESCTVAQIMKQFSPMPSRCIIFGDLKWLSLAFPASLTVCRTQEQDRPVQTVYSWKGPVPYLQGKKLSLLTEKEIVALEAVRSSFLDLDASSPPVDAENKSTQGMPANHSVAPFISPASTFAMDIDRLIARAVHQATICRRRL